MKLLVYIYATLINKLQNYHEPHNGNRITNMFSLFFILACLARQRLLLAKFHCRIPTNIIKSSNPELTIHFVKQIYVFTVQWNFNSRFPYTAQHIFPGLPQRQKNSTGKLPDFTGLQNHHKYNQ